jgi:hypothetical protein
MDALHAYVESPGDSMGANDFQTWLQDMLCDLRHLAKREGLSFDTANTNAGRNFEEELEGR